MCGCLRGVRHRCVGSSAAMPVCHDMRPSAAGAIPAPAVPPIITVPMPIVPMGAGDGSGGRAYRCAAPAANGAADNGASHGALRKGLRERNRYRKTKQEQQNQAPFHVAFPHHSTRFCCVVSLSRHRASRAIGRDAGTEVGQLYVMGPDALSLKTLKVDGEYTEGGTLFANSTGKMWTALGLQASEKSLGITLKYPTNNLIVRQYGWVLSREYRFSPHLAPASDFGCRREHFFEASGISIARTRRPPGLRPGSAAICRPPARTGELRRFALLPCRKQALLLPRGAPPS